MLTVGAKSDLATVLSFFAMLLLKATHSQEIVIPPRNMVGFAGSELIFTCGTNDAPSVTWKVNGTYFSRLRPSLHGDWHIDPKPADDIDINTLTVPARAEYNGTWVQCIAIKPGEVFVESENATFLVQGLLATVSDLKVKSGQGSILLSWSPPFSLDVTGVDPDIWYTVLISNVTDEDNSTAVPCTDDCHNLTQPHYTFTTDNPSPCLKYSFTVIPQNGAGDGKRSASRIGNFISEPTSINSTDIKIYSQQKSLGKYEFTILLPTLAGVCVGEFPEHYLVYFETEYNIVKCPVVVTSLLETDNNHHALSFDIDVENIHKCVYSITVQTINEAGRTNSSGSIILCKGRNMYYSDNSSCDLKSHTLLKSSELLTDIQVVRNNVNVHCTFSYTLLHRCYVLAIGNTYYEAAILEGEQSANYTFSDLQPGVYTMLIYGMEEEFFFFPYEKPDYFTVISLSDVHDTHLESFNATSHFTFQEGLGFGAALGFMVTLIVTITTVLAASARARVLKGNKRKMLLKKNAAYEVHAFTSKRLSRYIMQTQPPNTPHGTSQPEVLHISSERNPVYEEVQ